MAKFSERFRRARMQSGLTYEQVSDQIFEITQHRYTRGAISKWARDGIKKPEDITESSRRALAKVLGVNHDWLIHGVGREHGPPGETFAWENIDNPISSAQGYVSLIVYTPRAAISKRGAIHVKFEAGKHMITIEQNRLPSASDISNLRTIEVTDDTMARTLCKGEMAVIDLGQTTIENESVYAMAYGDGLRIKRLSWTADGRLRVVSDNPIYREELIEKKDVPAIQVMGRIVLRWGGGGL